MKNYDYTKPGLYYLTLCCQERAHLFGTIEEGILEHNPAGRMIAEQWQLLSQRFPHIRLHDFVVMPNHLHGVLEIMDSQNPTTFTTDNFTQSAGVEAALVAALGNKPNNFLEEPDMGYIIEERAALVAAPTPAEMYTEQLLVPVNSIIGAFKSISTVKYIKGVKEQDWAPFNKKVWQRNYWERVIRTQAEYENNIGYIQTNPVLWKSDFFVQ